MARQRGTARQQTSQPVHVSRLRRLRRVLRARELDALLVTNPRDIEYLTGFHGDASHALVGQRALHVVSDFRFEEELASIGVRATVVIRTGPIADATGGLLRDLDLAAVGVQAEHMTLAQRGAIGKVCGARRLRPAEGLVDGLRVVKDEEEVRRVRRAVRAQERALHETLGSIGPGLRERDICAELEYQMKLAGGQGPAFGTIVAARANGSLPHAIPGATKTRAGGPVLIDWGVRMDGYCSDMTRTFSLGRWPAELREVYGIVLEAQLAAIDAIAPGVACRDVDAAARDVITGAGYGDRFGHALGHGIGLDVHESPRLASRSDEVLAPGMIVTVEPGIYLPGVGGVRIEDDVLVTERGRRNLSSLPKDIEWATL